MPVVDSINIQLCNSKPSNQCLTNCRCLIDFRSPFRKRGFSSVAECVVKQNVIKHAQVQSQYEKKKVNFPLHFSRVVSGGILSGHLVKSHLPIHS